MTSTSKSKETHAEGPVTKAVGIWIRVSTEDQARGESPVHHEARGRAYAEAKGWEVFRIYDLSGVSGKSVWDHPECVAMREDVRTGRIAGLIFSKLARLARNTRELLDFADYFKAHNADLVSLQESIDTSTPAGRFFYTMIAGMAEWEREEIASRVAASVPIRAKLGKPLGGSAPFGYQWKDRKLVPEPSEAPVRRLIHELFLEHRRVGTVARLLNDMGHRTRGGYPFTDTTVYRLLRDPTAKGVRRANYTKSGPKGKTFKPRQEWIETPVEAIVSADLWDQCNVLLDERKELGKRPGRRSVHLFSGFTYCFCGQKMYVPSNTPKYVCKTCHNKIPVGDLEAVFHEQLRHFVFSPEEMRNYFAQTDEGIRQKEELLRSLEAERVRVQAEMDMVYRAYVSGELPVQAFGSRYRPLEERLSQLSDEIPRLQGETDFLKIQKLSGDEILSEAQDLQDRWKGLSPEDKRKVVENVTERVVIGKDEVTIELCHLPASSENVTTSPRKGCRW